MLYCSNIIGNMVNFLTWLLPQASKVKRRESLDDLDLTDSGDEDFKIKDASETSDSQASEEEAEEAEELGAANSLVDLAGGAPKTRPRRLQAKRPPKSPSLQQPVADSPAVVPLKVAEDYKVLH